MTTQTEQETKLDRLVVFLRSLSGFISCLTVAATSVGFIYTVQIAVTEMGKGWPEPTKVFLMMVGPVIGSWHFLNARSIIATILSTEEELKEGEGEVKPVVIPKQTPVVTQKDIALEREICGTASVLMRAIAGTITTIAICVGSGIFAYTIHLGILKEVGYPDDTTIFLVVVGPIIASWNFIKVSSTLGLVIAGGNKISKLRNTLAEIIKPKP